MCWLFVYDVDAKLFTPFLLLLFSLIERNSLYGSICRKFVGILIQYVRMCVDDEVFVFLNLFTRTKYYGSSPKVGLIWVKRNKINSEVLTEQKEKELRYNKSETNLIMDFSLRMAK